MAIAKTEMRMSLYLFSFHSWNLPFEGGKGGDDGFSPFVAMSSSLCFRVCREGKTAKKEKKGADKVYSITNIYWEDGLSLYLASSPSFFLFLSRRQLDPWQIHTQ